MLTASLIQKKLSQKLIQKTSFPLIGFRISKEVQPSLLPASNDLLRTKTYSTLHFRICDLFTDVLFTVVQSFVTDVLLGRPLIDVYKLGILPVEQKADVQN